MTLARLFALVWVLISWSALAAQNKSVFNSYTEEPTTGWRRIAESLSVQLVTSAGTKDYADQCIQDNGLAKNYRQFLVTKAIPLSSGTDKFIFVRPAAKPYCSAFYGAHIYSFWIVDRKQQIVFSTSADEFSVLSSSHGGMRDLLVSQCRASYCYRSTFVFEAHTYREKSCVTTTIQTNASVPGCHF